MKQKVMYSVVLVMALPCLLVSCAQGKTKTKCLDDVLNFEMRVSTTTVYFQKSDPNKQARQNAEILVLAACLHDVEKDESTYE